jgi:type II secretory pathway predicted ATPase ExeA
MITGPVGAGKSKALQAISVRLGAIPDLTVGVMERPQSATSDFYRELGRLFGVDLSPANRYGGFRALRERWEGHIQSCLRHSVLLIDEAQEMHSACLSELRLLGSVSFDSRYLLTVVLCGDERLPERFRARDLQPLGSRIRTRLNLAPLDKPELRELLEHLLERSGNPGLIDEALKPTPINHAAGNPRILCNMAADTPTSSTRRVKVVDCCRRTPTLLGSIGCIQQFATTSASTHTRHTHENRIHLDPLRRRESDGEVLEPIGDPHSSFPLPCGLEACLPGASI